MMKRRKSEPIDEVLMRFSRLYGLESPLNEYRLIEFWPEVAGELIASATTDLYISNQKLIVRLSQPALRADLMMMRNKFVNELNAKVGANVIIDIILK